MRWVYPPFVGGRGAVGLLLLRVVMGAAFVLHGWPKIQHPFDWMPTALGQAPAPMQALAALAEFGGGICLILGLLTPLAALGIGATMVTAFLLVHRNDPFVSPKPPSFELPAVYLGAALLFLLAGPGTLSLDALLFGRRKGPGDGF